jgi:hypothetical protein
MLTNEYPIVSSNLTAGFGVYGTCDPYNSAAVNYGALNPPGSIWTIPSPSQSGITLGQSPTGADTNVPAGYGSYLTVKYVRYNSTANPAVQTGPAPVYWVDETLTTVSGRYSEATTTGSSAIAGWLLPNSGTVAGIGLGTTVFTNTILNGNWVFIAVEGFVPSCYLAAGAIGQPVTGASGDFTVAVTTGVLRTCGFIWGAVASNIGNVLATVGIY